MAAGTSQTSKQGKQPKFISSSDSGNVGVEQPYFRGQSAPRQDQTVLEQKGVPVRTGVSLRIGESHRGVELIGGKLLIIRTVNHSIPRSC